MRVNVRRVAAASSCETYRTLSRFRGHGYCARCFLKAAVGSVERLSGQRVPLLEAAFASFGAPLAPALDHAVRFGRRRRLGVVGVRLLSLS